MIVLIPVYNEERAVEALLKRVADGPYSDKQAIVIDDGSSDSMPRLQGRRGRCFASAWCSSTCWCCRCAAGG